VGLASGALAVPAGAQTAQTAQSTQPAQTAQSAQSALSAQSAQTISVAPGCYVNDNPMTGTPIVVAGSGWTAGDDVEITGAGVDGSATVGPQGTFSQTITGPILLTENPAEQRFTLRASDETTGTGSATTTINVANLAVATRPAEAPFTKKVSFSFSGFREGRPIYAHYLHNGKVVATQRFGTAAGPCGMLKARRLQYPGGHPRRDSYVVQFDDSKRYSQASTPRIVRTLQIYRF
jgi:hypothetical protein